MNGSLWEKQVIGKRQTEVRSDLKELVLGGCALRCEMVSVGQAELQ